jgi:hypothetical protein
MDQGLKKQIKEIMGKLECPLDFECLKSGVEKACKAREVGLKQHLLCLEQHPADCGFSVSFGSVHFCRCPLRVYICKNIGK